MSKHINSVQEFADTVKQDGTVLVDFWAAWCGPCRQLSKELDKVQDQVGDKLTIAKVNVDEQQDLAAFYKVTSIPMMLVFKDGKPVDQLIGARPAARLMSDLQPHLA